MPCDIICRNGQGSRQGHAAVHAMQAGHDMGCHKGITCASHARCSNLRRVGGNDAMPGARVCHHLRACRDQHVLRAMAQQGMGGIFGCGVMCPGQKVGFFKVDIQRGARVAQQRGQTQGLAGAGRCHARVPGSRTVSGPRT